MHLHAVPRKPCKAGRRVQLRALQWLLLLSTSLACLSSPPAPFLRQSLMGEGRAMVVCSGPESSWEALRVMRCARSMLVQVRTPLALG
jgi:hypothetical protein